MIALTLVVLLLQGDGWTASPSRTTVGDTIRLERTLPAPAGWRVRTAKLASSMVAEPLGDPVVVATAAGYWVVRYTVVAWRPGEITLDMPPIWRLGPDGTADSLPGGTAAFHIASVIPDSVKAPAPQPAVGPLRLARTSPIPAFVGVIVAGGALLLLIVWRRRGPRVIATSALAGLVVDGEVPDTRWLSAGEPKAVAARATQRLRRAVARAIPDAHEALSTTECLEAVERARPNAPLPSRANSARTDRRHELRATAAAVAARGAPAVVVVAAPAAREARGRADERCPAGVRTGGAVVDRTPAGLAAIALPRRVDRRRGRSASRLGARGAAQRGDLDRAGGRYLACQPARCRAAHGDRIRARAVVGSDRARRFCRAGVDAGAHHDGLRGAGGSDSSAARGHSRGWDGDRHRDRHEREPVTPRPGEEQGRGAAQG